MKTLRRMLGLAPTPAGSRRELEAANRRQATRYRSSSAVNVGWWDGEEFRSAEGALLDISQGRAAIAVRGADTPPTGPAHLRLLDSDREDWADVTILAIRRISETASIAHLQFHGGCSYAIFREVLNGTDLNGQGACYDSAEFDTRIWR